MAGLYYVAYGLINFKAIERIIRILSISIDYTYIERCRGSIMLSKLLAIQE